MTELLVHWLRGMARCTGCGRVIIEEGARKRLEAAWDRDGNHAVLGWFQRLIDGPWDDEPKWMQKLGAEARLEILADLAIRFEDYCRNGKLRVPTELNTLDAGEGLLEIKVARGRVPIYESQGEYGSTRCTHGFYKHQQKTPKMEISRGLAIMRADRSR